MSEWTSADRAIHVSVCVIIKRRKAKHGRWEYQLINSFEGEWNDLVYELLTEYNQFKDEVDHLPSKSARHDKLDAIATHLEKSNVPYEFMLPDKTDDWYVAYVKPAIFRIDAEGLLR
jgi:hypothetical protein